jgi:hypothetical protein
LAQRPNPTMPTLTGSALMMTLPECLDLDAACVVQRPGKW